MKKRVSILTTIIIALVCVIVTFQITAVAYWKRQHSGSSAPADTSDTSSYESLKEKLDEINGIYREYYFAANAKEEYDFNKGSTSQVRAMPQFSKATPKP